MSLRSPEKVGAQIVLSRHNVRARDEAPGLALHAVRLHSQRIHDEDECATAVVKRVEVDLDIVVPADAIAIGERRVHPRVAAMWLERPDAEVDRRGGIPDE